MRSIDLQWFLSINYASLALVNLVRYGAKTVQVPGLYVRDGKRGAVYKFKMDLRRKGAFVETVYATIGRTDVVSYEKAVAEAARLAQLIRSGKNPTRTIDPSTLTVLELMQRYSQDLEARGKGERFRQDVVVRAERYLPRWLDRPFVQISRQDCRDAHARITRDNGPRVANQTITNFGTAWRIAQKTLDGDIPMCPVDAVRLHQESPKDYGAFDLNTFWQDVQKANPTRRFAWSAGILSGLRPGNLKSLRRDWLHEDRLIIPRSEMKVRDARRGPFIVPLSEPLAAILQEAATHAAKIAPDSPWVFWAASDSGHLENTHPYGHVLRHVHRTACVDAGIHPEVAAVLHDHAIEGIAGVYVQRAVINFAVLKEAQEKVGKILRREG